MTAARIAATVKVDLMRCVEQDDFCIISALYLYDQNFNFNSYLKLTTKFTESINKQITANKI